MLALTRQLMMLLLLLPALAAAQQQASEYELKAAFLYNFATYVDWPPQAFAAPDAPFVFGILGGQDMVDNLALIVRERRVKERRVEVRRLNADQGAEGLHVLFVDAEQAWTADALLSEALARNVLTVSEEREPAVASTITFAIVDGKVRFDVHLPLAQQAGLTVSSRLLGVARQVIGQAP